MSEEPSWICPGCGRENFYVDGDNCVCGYIISREEYR